MELPKRDANGDDPVVYPNRSNERSASNSYNEAAWLNWRLSDAGLDPDLRTIMEVELVEVTCLGRLLEALEQAKGDTLEAKMRDPRQRDELKTLSLTWLRSQRALIDATTGTLDRRAGGNGH